MRFKTAFKLFLIAIFLVLCARTNSVCLLFADEDDNLGLPSDYANTSLDTMSTSIDFSNYTQQISNMPDNPVVSYVPNGTGTFDNGAMSTVATTIYDQTNYLDPPIELVAANTTDPLYAAPVQRSTEDWGKIAIETPSSNTFENQEYQHNKYTSTLDQAAKQMDQDRKVQTTINGSMGTLKF